MLWKFFGWVCTVSFFCFALGGASILGIFYNYGKGLPDCRSLKEYAPSLVMRFYDDLGKPLAEYSQQRRIFLSIESIPPLVVSAVLSAEDRNFYHHPGFDVFSIVRALWTNLFRNSQKRPVGASTITQQVAKNFLLRSNEISLVRKIKEVILAVRLEREFSKKKILELYLNEIYWGNGSYGIGAAALSYFNKFIQDLTIDEVAFLAGLPKAPSRYQPKKNLKLALDRRNWVLKRMREEGVITSEQEINSKQTGLNLYDAKAQIKGRALYFSEHIRRQLIQRYGEEEVYTQGWTVRTTLNGFFQKIAEESLAKGLQALDRRQGWRGPIRNWTGLNQTNWKEWLKSLEQDYQWPGKILAVVLDVNPSQASLGLISGCEGVLPLSEVQWVKKSGSVLSMQHVLRKGDVIWVSMLDQQKKIYTLEQKPQANGALVAMDPKTGRVLALVGGYDWRQSQFDRSTQAMRQPGSAFKPFVYLAALEKGLTPSTLVSDEGFVASLGEGKGFYTPQNITKKFFGPTTLRTALEQSRNIVTVRLGAEYIGMEPIVQIAKKFDIHPKLPAQLAVTLGAGETTLLSLTTAYGMIANGGYHIKPRFVDLIHDRHGRIIYQAYAAPLIQESQQWGIVFSKRKALLADPVSIYQLTYLLEGVVRRGTASRLYKELPSLILAGKTGTSSRYRDAWFIGFLPNLVVGVFVGRDDFQSLGEKEGGARVALPIFLSFMQAIQDHIPSTPFFVPQGVCFQTVNRLTGQPATLEDKDIILEAFRYNSIPD